MMKHKLLSLLLCLLALFLLQGTIPVSAEEQDGAEVSRAREILDGILAEGSEGTVQAWLDGELTQNAGVGSEWFVLALAQSGDYDFSAYEEALLTYLEAHTVGAAASRLKYALCLAAIGSTSSYISQAIEDAIGQQGLMSLIFGLHLLNNGYGSTQDTVSGLIAELLELQCADGGWSITGQSSDADATAMAVQALAPHYQNDAEVSAAVDAALLCLSQKQLADGDFLSYGVPNPESAAQVLIALSALGIDAATDERFIKNGKDLFDGIEKYRLAGGGFCHVAGGERNGTATAQALLAMLSYLRLSSGDTPLYLLDRADPAHVSPAPGVPADDGREPDAEPDGAQTSSPNRYKWWVSLIVLGLGGVACLLLYVLKKRHVKNFVAVMLAIALMLTAVWVTDIRSADDYYNGAEIKKEHAIGTVTLTIRCDAVAGRAAHIPEDGVILGVIEIPIEEGDSVYTVLTDAARCYRLRIENSGNAVSVYISGINGLYALDYGDLSGWTYLVNGEQPSVGAGEYKLRDGDVVEWCYSLELGQDLK